MSELEHGGMDWSTDQQYASAPWAIPHAYQDGAYASFGGGFYAAEPSVSPAVTPRKERERTRDGPAEAWDGGATAPSRGTRPSSSSSSSSSSLPPTTTSSLLSSSSSSLSSSSSPPSKRGGQSRASREPAAAAGRGAGARKRSRQDSELDVPPEISGMTSTDVKVWLDMNSYRLSEDQQERVSKYMIMLRNRETAVKSRERKKERLASLEGQKTELQKRIEEAERSIELRRVENAALRQQLASFLGVVKNSRTGKLFQRMMVMERGHQMVCSSSSPELNLTEQCVNALAIFLSIALSNFDASMSEGLLDSAMKLKGTMQKRQQRLAMQAGGGNLGRISVNIDEY